VTPTPLRSFRMNLRAHLARVAKGEALSLTLHGRPVAEVTHPGGARFYQSALYRVAQLLTAGDTEGARRLAWLAASLGPMGVDTAEIDAGWEWAGERLAALDPTTP